MIEQVVLAFVSSIAFALLFHVPRKQYLYCGITGGAAWLFYLLAFSYWGSPVISSLAATLALSFMAKLFAVRRSTPALVFLIAGIFPLVPGAGIYYTVHYLIMGDNALAFSKGLETLKIAVVIALGMVLVASIPYRFFHRLNRYLGWKHSPPPAR